MQQSPQNNGSITPPLYIYDGGRRQTTCAHTKTPSSHTRSASYVFIIDFEDAFRGTLLWLILMPDTIRPQLH